jgi:hypothetical protein
MSGAAREQRALLGDEELRRRAMASPAVQARIAEIQADRTDPPPPGLTKEDLVEILRERE